MAGSQEIRTQIKSIQNTQKITKAMEMVAASKMRKAISQMEKARSYAEKISEVMTHLANAHPEYDSAFFEIRTIKKRGYIVISSDRGLCGGLNNNLFKNMIQQSMDNKNNEIESSYSVIGNKAAGFFQRIGGEVISQSTHLGDKPQIEDLLGTIKSTIDKFFPLKYVHFFSLFFCNLSSNFNKTFWAPDFFDCWSSTFTAYKYEFSAAAKLGTKSVHALFSARLSGSSGCNRGLIVSSKNSAIAFDSKSTS